MKDFVLPLSTTHISLISEFWRTLLKMYLYVYYSKINDICLEIETHLLDVILRSKAFLRDGAFYWSSDEGQEIKALLFLFCLITKVFLYTFKFYLGIVSNQIPTEEKIALLEIYLYKQNSCVTVWKMILQGSEQTYFWIRQTKRQKTQTKKITLQNDIYHKSSIKLIILNSVESNYLYKAERKS